MTLLRRTRSLPLRGPAGSSVTLATAALVVLLAVFTALAPGLFLTAFNVSNIMSGAAILIVLAVASTLVLAVGDFDLSIGAVLVFASVIGAKAMLAVADLPPAAVILTGLIVTTATGAAAGALSGWLIAYARIPSIIATLGVLGLLTGFSNLLTGGVDVRGLPPALSAAGNLVLFGFLPLPGLIALVLAAAVAWLIRATAFGRNTIALGSNREALRRAGLNVERQRLAVFALAGSFYGLGAFLSLARYSTTTISGHGGDMLQAYTAAILGGSSPLGGSVTIIGTVVGVFIPTVLDNGFVVLGVDPFWQQVAVGAVLLAAVYIQRVRRNRS